LHRINYKNANAMGCCNVNPHVFAATAPAYGGHVVFGCSEDTVQHRQEQQQ
jgi:hypothetical protein